MAPRPHSRSVSVLSSAGRQEDDISTIMMRGATDLRNAKFETEEQRREIAFLQEQLECSRKEKSDLVQRLKAVKDAAKQSLQSSSKSLETLRVTINDLKSQSETSFGMTSDIRTSLADVQELRDTISQTIKSIEPHLEHGERWEKSMEAKNLMNELELECSRSQQVADILRDRLQSVGGELIEAKSRVSELEDAHAEERSTLCKANATIASMTEEISSIAACLKKQQADLHVALITAADFEAKFVSATERIEELRAQISQKNGELDALNTVRAENERLQHVIEEKESYISSLHSLETDITALKATLAERENKISRLTAHGASKDAQISEYTSRIGSLDIELAEANEVIQRLQNELGTSTVRVEVASNDNDKLMNEQQALHEKIQELSVALDQARREGEAHAKDLLQSNARCQALEERFEDQSVTLRLTRDLVGDVQERLLAAETSHAKNMAEATAKLQCEISVLQEQKLGLQSTMDVMQEALRREEASARAIQNEHADRLRQQESMSNARLEAEAQRSEQLARDLEQARARSNSAEKRIEGLEDDLRDLRDQLRVALLPSPETETELRTLRGRVAALEAAEMKSTLRAKTIDARYRVGDLNDEEKTFVNTLIQTSQAIHEQELVANRNELRRRDNALKEMRSKVHLLESTLAKHLKAQKAKAASAAQDNRSMIDPAAWMSQSGQSSSPVQAPDRDGATSTNVDQAVSSKRVPAMSPAAPAALVHSPVAQVTLAKDVVNAGGQAAAKPKFSRLATDCSDEILDFDDDPTVVRKPTPPSSLGKRNKPDSRSPKLAPDQGAPKPYKRLRASTRRTEAPETDAGAGSKKLLQPSSSKNRARKRR
ncbi:hypothetical protein L227DRAFT_17539 [Lentinus tigrinus ALCF2SS1-6]|uniref:Uncharacterized protein n=1 Tax=Lentinus tigrinus ALCF2SS1-6 TaxID=1328759 RepID=A0A5C2SW72_9APHY|nr:hypothetical protein L227DRAFT_17539 [Lentinus tigrinus ALCF2SS1-6]